MSIVIVLNSTLFNIAVMMLVSEYDELLYLTLGYLINVPSISPRARPRTTVAPARLMSRIGSIDSIADATTTINVITTPTYTISTSIVSKIFIDIYARAPTHMAEQSRSRAAMTLSLTLTIPYEDAIQSIEMINGMR